MRLKWRGTLHWGAVVTALLFTLGRFLIALYLAYTATASTFGAAGSVVLLLLWGKLFFPDPVIWCARLPRAHLEAKGRKHSTIQECHSCQASDRRRVSKQRCYAFLILAQPPSIEGSNGNGQAYFSYSGMPASRNFNDYPQTFLSLDFPDSHYRCFPSLGFVSGASMHHPLE